MQPRTFLSRANVYSIICRLSLCKKSISTVPFLLFPINQAILCAVSRYENGKRRHSAAKPFLAHSPSVTVQASAETREPHSLSPAPPGMVPRNPRALVSKARRLELRLPMEVSCLGSEAVGFAGKQDPGELPPQQRWLPPLPEPPGAAPPKAPGDSALAASSALRFYPSPPPPMQIADDLVS